jgi:hypothetical protein
MIFNQARIDRGRKSPVRGVSTGQFLWEPLVPTSMTLHNAFIYFIRFNVRIENDTTLRINLSSNVRSCRLERWLEIRLMIYREDGRYPGAIYISLFQFAMALTYMVCKQC